jgi:hypothetical protein
MLTWAGGIQDIVRTITWRQRPDLGRRDTNRPREYICMYYDDIGISAGKSQTP